jgi:hypothetical protein
LLDGPTVHHCKQGNTVERIRERRESVRIPPHAIFPYAFEAGIRARKTCAPPSHEPESSQWRVVRLHLLTVAGAAQASRQSLTSPRGPVIACLCVMPVANNSLRIPLPGSRLTRSPKRSKHLKRGRILPESTLEGRQIGGIPAITLTVAERAVLKRTGPVDAATICEL